MCTKEKLEELGICAFFDCDCWTRSFPNGLYVSRPEGSVTIVNRNQNVTDKLHFNIVNDPAAMSTKPQMTTLEEK